MVNISQLPGIKITIWLRSVLVLGAILLLALMSVPTTQAHCDSREGPVAIAAGKALETGDVTPVLPYVAPEYEAELVAAFQHVLEVRPLGESAQALAEEYFMETAVRLHRTGEGAAYTGLTDEEVPEAIALADDAMESGSLDAIYAFMDTQMQTGMTEHFQELIEAQEYAEAEGSVEAHRERVEAELGFEKYVYTLYLTLTGPVGHEGEGQHQH